MKLWKYNKITGYWASQREVSPDTAQQWLSIFQKDEPNEIFKLSVKKPTTNNKQNS